MVWRCCGARSGRKILDCSAGLRSCCRTTADQTARYAHQEVVLAGWPGRLSHLSAEPALEYSQSLALSRVNAQHSSEWQRRAAFCLSVFHSADSTTSSANGTDLDHGSIRAAAFTPA